MTESDEKAAKRRVCPASRCSRVWTREELDRVWTWSDERKAEGWSWAVDGYGEVVACGPKGLTVEVEVDGTLLVLDRAVERAKPPAADICLAVCSAHLGLDSPAELARKLNDRAEMAQREADAQLDFGRSLYCEGQAHAWRDASSMLSRGRVAP